MAPERVPSSTGHRCARCLSMPADACQPTLRVDHLVDRKLLDVGWPLRLDSCGRHSFHDPRGEGVEVVAGLPEVYDSPATIDRPRCVEEEPLRWCAIGVGVIVSLVELLLSDPWELDADADSHPQPLFRWGARCYASDTGRTATCARDFPGRAGIRSPA